MTGLVEFASTLPRQGLKLWGRLRQRSSSNFKFAFLFLQPQQRHALELVYEFCRVVDDIVDERPSGHAGEVAARQQLAEWTAEIARIYAGQPGHFELGRQLAVAHQHFDFPRYAFEEIIAGVAMDLERDTYDHSAELRTYCYRVASCVGLLCIAIFGERSERAQLYAEHLGLALQYTNILRDVGEDAVRGRVYLPLELLDAHGVTRDDIVHQRYDRAFQAAAAEFAALAEREYQMAWSYLDGLDKRALLPAEIMGRTYYEILQGLRSNSYNVFACRPQLRRRDKLRVAMLAVRRVGFHAS